MPRICGSLGVGTYHVLRQQIQEKMTFLPSGSTLQQNHNDSPSLALCFVGGEKFISN